MESPYLYPSSFAGNNVRAMFNSADHLSDLQFIVITKYGIQKRVYAHKNVLASASPVFRSMFYGDLKENGDVCIKDVSAEAFEEFMQFFYKSMVIFTIDNIAEVLRLIDKYDMPDCYEPIELFIGNSLNVENVCFFYELATSFQLSDWLIKGCEAIIKNESKAVFDSVYFVSIGEEALMKIMQFTEFSCREIDVFNAAIAWARRALADSQLDANVDHIKAKLSSVIPLIRFPTMSACEFAQIWQKYPNILEWAVYSDVLLNIVGKFPLTFREKFNATNRCIIIID